MIIDAIATAAIDMIAVLLLSFGTGMLIGAVLYIITNMFRGY